MLNWKFLEKILILTLSYLCLFHEYLYDWSFSCHRVFSCLLFHQHLRYNSNTENFILWSVQCKDYQHVPKGVWLWPSIPFQNIFVVGYILDVPQKLVSWGLGPKSTYYCDEVETWGSRDLWKELLWEMTLKGYWDSDPFSTTLSCPSCSKLCNFLCLHFHSEELPLHRPNETSQSTTDKNLQVCKLK